MHLIGHHPEILGSTMGTTCIMTRPDVYYASFMYSRVIV